MPVLIRASALADGVPRRDLFVSPQHAMFLDGVLIPAIYLVNGASIVRVERMEQVDYFHLELETHDVIWPKVHHPKPSSIATAAQCSRMRMSSRRSIRMTARQAGRSAPRAHSGDLERSIRSIMNTGSGDHEHLGALA